MSTVVEDTTNLNEIDELNLDHLSEALNPVDNFTKQVEIRKGQAAEGTSLNVSYEMSEAQSHDPFDPDDDDVTGYPV